MVVYAVLVWASRSGELKAAALRARMQAPLATAAVVKSNGPCISCEVGSGSQQRVAANGKSEKGWPAFFESRELNSARFVLVDLRHAKKSVEKEKK